MPIFGAAVPIPSLVGILPRGGRVHVAVSVAASTMIVLMLLLLLSDRNRPFAGPGTLDFDSYRAAVRNLGASLADGGAS